MSFFSEKNRNAATIATSKVATPKNIVIIASFPVGDAAMCVVVPGDVEVEVGGGVDWFCKML